MARPIPTQRYLILLVLALLAGLSFVGSDYQDYLPLQHIPTALALLAAIFYLRKYEISNTAFYCFSIFMALHILGARYVYSYVPYDHWSLSAFGVSINETFGWTRNHYDRFVHFAFGFLFYMPIREVIARIFHISDKKASYLTMEFVIALSAVYELLEWLIAMVLAPDQAEAYNGQQGDMWDAQKDMTLALAGAVVAMLIRVIFKKRTKGTA